MKTRHACTLAVAAILLVAALLCTYRCTIASRHCCFGRAASRPDVHMDMELVTLEARWRT